MTFAIATTAPKPKTKNSQIIALFLAGLLVVMAVGQLFSFEKFIPLIETYLLPGGYGMAVLVASLLVISEVFALPFLLRMKMSLLMRYVSMACGWIVAAVWLKLTLWANVIPTDVQNVGFFGPKVELFVGWWATLFAAALIVLVVWAAWGLGPFGRAKK